MAKERNPDRHRISSPPVTLKYPKLDKVDYGSEKYPDKDGSYNTRIIADRHEPKVASMLAKIDQVMERAEELAREKFAKLDVKARKKLEAKNGAGGITRDEPYSPVYDEDTEEDTGKIEMKIKMKASGVRKDKSKWTAKPDLFDNSKPPKPLKVGTQIWGGSVAVVNFDIEPYFVDGSGAYGVARRLNAVQVKELVSGGQRSASSYGFEGDDDGFDADSVEIESEDTSADDGDDGDDDDANF